ncbi:MAG: hypothetical protein IJO32_04070 [Bacilli bacterium]|nr:hypothetical protein [Bacilli bacterium]
MENKSWNEYSKEDKNELLQHWWYYYGKVIITMDEWEQFNKLVEKDSDKIFELAVVAYMHKLSSQPLIRAMRENRIDELMLTIPNIDENEKNKDKILFKALYEELKKEFISMLVKTYNKTEPSIPMEKEVIAKQVKEIIKKK